MDYLDPDGQEELRRTPIRQAIIWGVMIIAVGIAIGLTLRDHGHM